MHQPNGHSGTETPQTVRRAIELLDLLATAPRGLSLKDLGENLGLTKSTAHRLVSGLVAGGLAEVSPETRRYRLGLKVIELSALILDSMDVREQAHPFMQQLSELSRETLHLGVLDHFEVLFVGHIESPESVRMAGRVGRIAPAHCSSLGKAMLATLPAADLDRYFLDRDLPALTPNTITDPGRLREELRVVQVRGYALDDEENRPGIRCIGAAVRDHTGKGIAAISISGPTFRFTAERAVELAAPLLAAANGISERMGWVPSRRRAAV